MHTFLVIFQAILALGVIVLMAVQTEEADQGGVMGIGGAGGREAGEIDLDVGKDRILKPLTRWICGGFLTISILAAIPADKINIWYLVVFSILFVIAMMYGALVWQVSTGMKRN